MFEHFKMYITITDVVEEKRIDLTYLIQNLDSSKEAEVVSMFSDNVQYWIKEPLKVLLIMNEKKQLLKGTFMGRELNVFIGRKVTTTPLDTNKNIIKMKKLAGVMEMVRSLDELNNNLEDGSLSKVTLRHHMIGSDEFTCLQPVTPQYKRIRNREFTSLTL